MHRFRSLSLFTRSLQKQSHNRYATVSAKFYDYLPNRFLQDKEEVLVEGRAFSRIALLNRPLKLNAITTSMAGRLQRLYKSWEDISQVGFVILKGSGRAFCSGADMVTIYRLLQEGNDEACKEFFRTFYHFIYFLGTYLKPNLAIMDGITMGGGAGVAIPGMFRVATDRTIFATPEVQMGFHPGAGASFYLSRLPGYLGEFLALTGQRLDGAELVACGLATHFFLNAKLAWIDERLGKLMTDDPSVISEALAQYGDLVYVDKNSVLHKINRIDSYFCHDTVEEIVEALKAGESHDEVCSTALKKMKEASPLSLKIALQSIREGRFQPFDECLAREYRTSLRFISKQVSGDFCEGVRARLVDKDFAPKWDTPSLEAVTKDMVDFYFAPLPATEPELNLPTALREPYM